MARTCSLLILVVLLGIAVLAPQPVRAEAEEGPPAMTLAAAQSDLLDLQTQLKKKRKANREDLIAAVDAVGKAYGNIKGPEKPELKEIPEDATEEEKAAIEAENKALMDAYEKEKKGFAKAEEDFHDDALKALLKALKAVKVGRASQNEWDDVTIQAARALAKTKEPKAATEIQRFMEKNLFKAKYNVTGLVLEELFKALGQINSIASLNWMRDEFIHTNNKQDEVLKLAAAHKAMILFQGVPGKVRYEIVKDMVKNYAPVETSAKQTSNDKNVQTAKKFWDQIKIDAIKVVQYFALEPADEEGQALAQMAEFEKWFRKHKNVRKAPWLDEE